LATTSGCTASQQRDLQVVGALPPFTEIRSITVAQGRFYNEEDNAEARNVAFLRQRREKAALCEPRSPCQTISLNGTPYTVIGVMKPKEQNSSYDGADVRKIFIPFNSMRRDFPNKRRHRAQRGPFARRALVAGDAS